MISVFIGENTIERDSALKKYIAKFVSNNGDMALDVLNSEDLRFNDVIDSVTTAPFLASKRMVIVRYLSGNKELADRFEDIAARIADSTELVLVETTLDNRSSYSKQIKKLADNYNLYKALDGQELIDWVAATTAQKGGNISNKDAAYLIDRVGQNQQLLDSEIEKLLLLDSTISKHNIDELTERSPQSSVFNMIDALMQGRIGDASKLYDEQRAQGVEPQIIMGMLTWQLSVLANIVAEPKDNPDIVAKRSKLSPFVVRKNYPLAKNINKSKMVQILDLAIDADKKIKTGKLKADNGVHSLLLQIGNNL